jgi:hypothetical protein
VIQFFGRVVVLSCGLALVCGCKSEADKCRERNIEVEQRQLAACKDDACKAKARKDRKDFDEACDNMK